MTTLLFCRRELDRYVGLICGEKANIELKVLPDGTEDLFEERGSIRVEGGQGEIVANRPRALLLSVYEFLRRLGCVFLRPGKEGEVIPRLPLSALTVHADFSPANRHRGITIEGAVSLENVLAIVDWAPKAGFNSYFVQFRTAHEFFKRWYGHSSNPFLEKQPIDEETSAGFVRRIVSEIKRRDMIYHAVGHGWTAEYLGIPSNGWSGDETPLSPGQTRAIAEIGGERKLFKGIPLNTQLCYSNPSVRSGLADEVVRYAEEHPETDVLHFWLADDYNNVCECESCAEKTVSDWYVMILNEIDEKLTAKGLEVKICFLVYFETYWTPKTERIRHPERFIMMFAPLFRSYTSSFADAGDPYVIPYEKNRMVYPSDPAAYLGFWKEWKEIFHGDTFDFDYHLMWDVNRDFGGERLAEVVYRDVRLLPSLGLNGFLSCQIQRAFYPNGLAFYLMGRALTDGEETLGNIRKTYYSAAFGKYAAFAEGVYADLERYAPFSFMRDESDGKEALPLLKVCLQKTEDVLADFPEGDDEGEVVRTSLSVLSFLLGNVRLLAEELIAKLEGADREYLARAEKRRIEFFNRNEEKYQPFVDGFYFCMITEGIVKSEKAGVYASD